MNPYQNNYTAQNQRVPYPNYNQGPITNPTQTPINNPNQIIQQYGSPQPIKKNPIPSGYNRINIRHPQINSAYQQQNIRVSPLNQEENLIQPQQNLKRNTQNILYILSPMINSNLVNKGYNQIPIQ